MPIRTFMKASQAGPVAPCRPQARLDVIFLTHALHGAAGQARAWHQLGIALAEHGDRAGALIALRHALACDFAHAPSNLALGRLLFDRGQVESALRCFERVTT